MKTSNSHPQPHHSDEDRDCRWPAKLHGWEQPRGRQRAALVSAFAMAVALILAGCATADPPPAAGTNTSIVTGSNTVPTTAAAATTAAIPVYKPATAQGPAQNVPVPVLPTKAKEFSKAGLEAFATYWYSTLGYAFETGDSQPMMSISDPSCKLCLAMKKGTTNGHANGNWIVGGQMRVLSTDSPFVRIEDGTYQAINMVRQEHVQYYRVDMSVAKDLGVTVAIADILVGVYKDGRWTATTVEHLQGSKKAS